MTPTASDYASVARSLDFVAHAIELTGNTNLLPVYKRLERELAALDTDSEVLARIKRRAGSKTAPRNAAFA